MGMPRAESRPAAAPHPATSSPAAAPGTPARSSSVSGSAPAAARSCQRPEPATSRRPHVHRSSSQDDRPADGSPAEATAAPPPVSAHKRPTPAAGRPCWSAPAAMSRHQQSQPPVSEEAKVAARNRPSDISPSCRSGGSCRSTRRWFRLTSDGSNGRDRQGGSQRNPDRRRQPASPGLTTPLRHAAPPPSASLPINVDNASYFLSRMTIVNRQPQHADLAETSLPLRCAQRRQPRGILRPTHRASHQHGRTSRALTSQTGRGRKPSPKGP